MKIKTAGLILLIIFNLSGCGDDSKEPECSSCTGIKALAVNDASGKGIYKGMIVGSSGTITFNIANNDPTISAELIIDGNKIELSTESQYSESFEGYLYGTLNAEDDVRIGFSASSSPGVINWDVFDIMIPGHPDVKIQVYKEFSDGQVKVYEGTLSGDAIGTFNILTFKRTNQQGYWVAVSKEEGANEVEVLDGGINLSGAISGGNNNVIVTGTVKGSNAKGSWKSKSELSSRTWKAKRTL